MLVLSRKLGQSFHVGPDVRITIVKIDRNSVRIGIHAPDDVSIQREEIAFEVPQTAVSSPTRPARPDAIATGDRTLVARSSAVGRTPADRLCSHGRDHGAECSLSDESTRWLGGPGSLPRRAVRVGVDIDAGGDRPGQVQGEPDGASRPPRPWRAAWHGLRPDASIDQVPMADGGEGTVDALVAATGGSYREAHGDRPAGRAGRGPVRPARRRPHGRARDGGGLGAGARPVRPARPLDATTRGTGELLLAAIAAGAQSRDRRHRRQRDQRRRRRAGPGPRLPPARRRRARAGTRRRQPGPAGPDRSPPAVDPSSTAIEVAVACDVDQSALRPAGRSAVYGPQKGATPAMIETLDANLAHFAAIVERDLGVAIARPPRLRRRGRPGRRTGRLRRRPARAGRQPGHRGRRPRGTPRGRRPLPDRRGGARRSERLRQDGRRRRPAGALARLPDARPGRHDRPGRRGGPRTRASTPISRSAPARSASTQAIARAGELLEAGDGAGRPGVPGRAGRSASTPSIDGSDRTVE